MKRAIVAAAAFAVPLAAQAADIRGDRYTTARLATPNGSTRSSLERIGDSDWFKVSLTAGRDYNIYFFADYGASLAVRSPSGTRLKTQQSYGTEGDQGVEFRPSVTGTFYLEMFTNSAAQYAPGIYDLSINSDCRTGTATHCTLPVGTTLTGQHCDPVIGGADWFKLSLQGGRSYTLSGAINGGSGSPDFNDAGPVPLALDVRNASGAKIAGPAFADAPSLPFTAPSTGTFYAVASCGNEDPSGGALYSIGLK